VIVTVLATIVPVMPEGHPDSATASVTADANPFAGITVTVELPLDPGPAEAGVADNVKLGGGVTVRAMAVEADSEPLVPFTVSE
jgi:hypothetical protein